MLQVTGVLENTGHDIRYTFESGEDLDPVRVASGPLSYDYQLYDLVIHFGSVDNFGSEHTVMGRQYPGEVRIDHCRFGGLYL